MNKLLFRKISYDIFYFFIAASLSISLIIWVFQAVNFLDFVTEDGHSLKVYFAYSILNLPKIFSKILIFLFFISCFYIVNKYEENNEILVFWTNGIKKISLINFLLKFSCLFILIQLTFSLYLVPLSQNMSRIYLKNSNVDFLPALITEKKFINVFQGLTIFLDKYDKQGNLSEIYINEKLNDFSSKIIIAQTGVIQKKNDQFLIKLFDGSIINSDEKNFYNINFRETEYDLSKFSSNTVTQQKIQQINSKILLNCIYGFYIEKKFENKTCQERKYTSISEEIYERLVVPFYILILSLISSSLLIKPKSNKYNRYFKSIVFLIGFLVIAFSQIGYQFFSENLIKDLIVVFFPIILVMFFYIIVLYLSNFKLRYL